MEGRTLVTQAYVDRLESDPGPLRYTDDTAMTIAVAESLTVRGLFDGADMAATLAARYAFEPWRGYGDGPPEVFGNLERGVAWDRAATSLFGGSGSFGNGAAMRVAPVALFGHPDTDHVAELARNSAVITHTHPEGIDGAVAQAVAIDHVLGLSPGVEPDPAALIDQVRRYVTTTKFHEKLEMVKAIVSTGDHLRLPVLGSGITAHASVPTALACFLLHAGSFPAGVKTAISLGGDTDTIAAMTGALVGAHLGLSAIPEQWRAVEGADQLVGLADALAGHRSD